MRGQQRWAMIGAGGVLGLGVLAALLLLSAKPAAPVPRTRELDSGTATPRESTAVRQKAGTIGQQAGPSGAGLLPAASGAVLHRVAFSRGDNGAPQGLDPAPPVSALAQRKGPLPSCPVSQAGAERHHKGRCAAGIEAGAVRAQIEVDGEMWFDETTGILHLVEGPATVRNLSAEQRLIVADRSGRYFTIQPLSRLDIDAPGPAPPDTPAAVAGDLPPTSNPGMHPPGPTPPGYASHHDDNEPLAPPPPDYPNPTPGRPLNP